MWTVPVHSAQRGTGVSVLSPVPNLVRLNTSIPRVVVLVERISLTHHNVVAVLTVPDSSQLIQHARAHDAQEVRAPPRD